jgi:hypothetical protein
MPKSEFAVVVSKSESAARLRKSTPIYATFIQFLNTTKNC